MPAHDWTRVDAGIFHAFHHDWITDLSRALNRDVLPKDYYALPEQIAGGFGPDVLTLRHPNVTFGDSGNGAGGVALAVTPPKVRLRMSSEANRYAAKAKSITVRHVSNHRVVAMVEIVSPGNKSSRAGLDAFVRKAHEALVLGIHLLIVDLFPPGPRIGQVGPRRPDRTSIGRTVSELPESISRPQNPHSVVGRPQHARGPDGPSGPTADKPLSCVSYIGGSAAEAFIESVGVGDALPEMPLFLTPEFYVDVPLETTYQSTWEALPAYWRNVLARSDA